MNRTVDLLIIGGGSAGLAAAIGAYEGGVRDILILEREEQLGGILRQCIHNGFGLHTFKEELTGPEYAARYVERVRALGIEALTGTMVLSLSADKVATAINQEGLLTVRAKAVVLAMGCRERHLHGRHRSENGQHHGLSARPARRYPRKRRYRSHHGPPLYAGGSQG